MRHLAAGDHARQRGGARRLRGGSTTWPRQRQQTTHRRLACAGAQHKTAAGRRSRSCARPLVAGGVAVGDAGNRPAAEEAGLRLRGVRGDRMGRCHGSSAARLAEGLLPVAWLVLLPAVVIQRRAVDHVGGAAAAVPGAARRCVAGG